MCFAGAFALEWRPRQISNWLCIKDLGLTPINVVRGVLSAPRNYNPNP